MSSFNSIAFCSSPGHSCASRATAPINPGWGCRQKEGAISESSTPRALGDGRENAGSVRSPAKSSLSSKLHQQEAISETVGMFGNSAIVQIHDLAGTSHGNNRVRKERRCDNEGTLICGRKPREYKTKDFGRRPSRCPIFEAMDDCHFFAQQRKKDQTSSLKLRYQLVTETPPNQDTVRVFCRSTKGSTKSVEQFKTSKIPTATFASSQTVKTKNTSLDTHRTSRAEFPH